MSAARLQEVGPARRGRGGLGLGVDAPVLGLPGLVDAGEIPGLGRVERAVGDREAEDERARERDQLVQGGQARRRRAPATAARSAARLAGGCGSCMTPVTATSGAPSRRAAQTSHGSQPAACRAASPSGSRGAVAEQVAGAVGGDRVDHRLAPGRDPVDRGIGGAGQRQPLGPRSRRRGRPIRRRSPSPAPRSARRAAPRPASSAAGRRAPPRSRPARGRRSPGSRTAAAVPRSRGAAPRGAPARRRVRRSRR